MKILKKFIFECGVSTNHEDKNSNEFVLAEKLSAIGAEEEKGNALVKETFPLLKECEEALIRLEDGYNYTSIAEENVHPNYYDWKKTANPITLERGHIELGRHAVNLTAIQVKKTKWNKTNIKDYLSLHYGKEEDYAND